MAAPIFIPTHSYQGSLSAMCLEHLCLTLMIASLPGVRSSGAFSVRGFNRVIWSVAFLPHLWISAYPVHLDGGDVFLECWPYQPLCRFTPSYLHHLDSVLVTYCYITDDHTLRVLRQHTLTSSEGQQCGELGWVLCSGDHKSTVKFQLDWPFIWRLKEKICFQGHSCWWWNTVLSGCRTQDPIFLAVGQELLSASRGHPHPLSGGPVCLQAAVVH